MLDKLTVHGLQTIDDALDMLQKSTRRRQNANTQPEFKPMFEKINYDIENIRHTVKQAIIEANQETKATTTKNR